MNGSETYPLRIPLTIEGDNPDDSNALLETGIPFALGSVNSLEQLRLECNGITTDCYAKTLSHWHDGSIRWVLIGFFTDPDKSTKYDLVIDPDNILQAIKNERLCFIEKDGQLEIKNSQYTFVLNVQTFTFSLESKAADNCLFTSQAGSVLLSDAKGDVQNINLSSWQVEQRINLVDHSCFAIEVNVCGKHVADNASELADFEAVFTLYHNNSAIKFEYCIHNPKPAVHSNGHWDLGDPNSLLFSSLDLVLALEDPIKVMYRTEVAGDWTLVHKRPAKLNQFSSGGENWQSPIHLDRNGKIPISEQGYALKTNNVTRISGLRATPSVFINNALCISMERFWQNFPKSIASEEKSISFGLFPRQSGELHELQGGEKKTHCLWLSATADKDSLNWVHKKPIIILEKQWYVHANAIQFLTPDDDNDAYSALIANGIDGDNNFFFKREIVDQYGWRNFGDIYADHETAEYSGEEIFVSHYNNQYDPIYGFIRQYMLNGDPRWFELADDLAKHVTDIDIYHTVDDKNEYNGGLFWHTDHYLQAHTSSHRSYSKLQASNAYHDHAGSGGPGGQHCYTTGLMLHYLLTGNDSSKQAVLTLTNWITTVYEGSDTCLELLLAFKNRHVPGFKNHFTGQYPLDRGTANYVISLLDSFELSQQKDYLHQAEHILLNSMHPEEYINKRDLHDVEASWFYTVLLQAICRYLQIKETQQAFDDSFYYCRDCLLNFADWMQSNERPYLEKPEILEYPNDTWTAQDLRKAQIFAAAYYYSAEREQKYLQKALFFAQYVSNQLNSSQSKTYTRIMVLLMQNHGATDYYEKTAGQQKFKERQYDWAPNDYQKTSLISGFCKVLLKRLRNLSLKNEINWLRKRLA